MKQNSLEERNKEDSTMDNSSELEESQESLDLGEIMDLGESFDIEENLDDSMIEKETGEKTSKQKPKKPDCWDLFITILKKRKKANKDNKKVPVDYVKKSIQFGEVKFGRLCALYRHVFKQKKRGQKADRRLTQQMIEEAQALGFDFDWDEEKDREKQKKKYLLDPQRYFENCAKVQAFYTANGHHFIPDDQPEAEWWKGVKQMAIDNTLPKAKRKYLEGIPLLTKKHMKGLDKFLTLRETFDSLSSDHKVRKWKEEVTDLACKGAVSKEQIEMFVAHQVFKREDLTTNIQRSTSHCQDNSEVSQETSQRNNTIGSIIFSSQTMNQGPNSNQTNEGFASSTSASSQSNDGSGMDEIPLLRPMNQGPNSNLTNEGFTSTTSASSQRNDGSAIAEIPPIPPLPNILTGKKLPELKKDVSGGFPLRTCDCCHNANIPTNHYCMKNVSQGALFVYRGPDGNEPEKQICGKAICFECKALAGIENSICPTCFLPIESQEELEGMGISDLRGLGERVRLGLTNIDKCRKATVIPALCETYGISYKAKKTRK